MDFSALALRAISLNPAKLKVKTPGKQEEAKATAPEPQPVVREPPPAPAPIARRGRLSVGGALAQRVFAAMVSDSDSEGEGSEAGNDENTPAADGAASELDEEDEEEAAGPEDSDEDAGTSAVVRGIGALQCEDGPQAPAWARACVQVAQAIDTSVSTGRLLSEVCGAVEAAGVTVPPNVYNMFYHIAAAEAFLAAAHAQECDAKMAGKVPAKTRRKPKKSVSFCTADLSTFRSTPNPNVHTGMTAASATCGEVDDVVSVLADVCTSAKEARAAIACPAASASTCAPGTVCGCPGAAAPACALGVTIAAIARHGDAATRAVLSAEVARLTRAPAPLPYERQLSQAVSAAMRFRLRRALNPDVVSDGYDDRASLRLGASQMKYALQDLAAVTHKALRAVCSLPLVLHCCLFVLGCAFRRRCCGMSAVFVRTYGGGDDDDVCVYACLYVCFSL